MSSRHVLSTINSNKRIRIFSAEIFSIQVASFILVQESSTALYAFMKNLFANNFPGLFSTNGDYFASRNCRKSVYFS